MKRGKKGQAVLFIILGLAIIGISLLILFLRGDRIDAIFSVKPPIDDIEQCIKENAKSDLEKIRMQGGSLNPENYYRYDGNKVDYICYSEEGFKQCVMQKPVLRESILKEVRLSVKEVSKYCLNKAKVDYSSKDYLISYKNPEIEAEIYPNNLLIKIKSDLSITKSGIISNYEYINIDLNTNLFKFIESTSKIANMEAKYGDSLSVESMLLDPSIKIEKKVQSESTRIYILTDRQTNEQFYFAIRSIPIPPGWIEVEE